MKSRVSLFSFLLITSFLFTSCTLDEETLAEIAGNENPTEEEPPAEEPPVEPEGELDINSTPCDYSLDVLSADGTLEIDCRIDLEGTTFSLPSNVTLVFNGGEIINGTLVFDDGKIDGNLMNQNLEIEGNVSLINETFQFHPERWDFVQGTTTSEIAQKNNNNLEDLMFYTKELGATTFVIDHFDAYFEVGKVTSTTTNQNFYPSVEAINVPGDYNLIMTENTHLRVFPNSQFKYALLAVRNVSNVFVQGGNLHGDRDEHDYSSGGSHEWGHLLDLHAAVDTRVDGVTMSMALGDGMKIHSLRHTFEPNYAPSNNILVTNCVFDNNRRNNLSITDGYNITIEGNSFLNASNDTAGSNGVAPGFAIDVEAYRRRGSDGELIYYEIARDVFIRNNTEENSRKGAITVSIGYDVTIEGNRTEKSISYSTAHGTRIVGNTVTAKKQSTRDRGTGIKGGKSGSSSPTIYDNKIYGNTVIGYNVAYNIGNTDVELYDNYAEDFNTGIYPRILSNAKVYNNELKSERSGSRGVYIFSTSISDVEFYNNKIEVAGNPYKCTAVNESLNDPLSANVTVRNETLISSGKTHFNRTNGLVFTDSNLDHGMEIFSSNELILSGNVINAIGDTDSGIYLRETNTDITLSGNNVTVDAGEDCIEIQNSTQMSEVHLDNNQCQD